MDPVIPQYIQMSYLLQQIFQKESIYSKLKAQESTAVIYKRFRDSGCAQNP